MGDNRNNQNQNQNRKYDLLDRNVEIDPVGVVYNVTGAAIEEFVYNYLSSMKGIDGVAAVRTHVIRDGAQKPEVALYVFLNTNSKDVVSNMGNIPDHIRRKMDEGTYRVSDKLKQALYPICKEFKVGVHPDRLLYVKCDVFKALGVMFAADPKIHAITIPEVVKLKKKNAIITIIKTNKFIDKEDAGSFDKFHDIIDHIES